MKSNPETNDKPKQTKRQKKKKKTKVKYPPTWVLNLLCEIVSAIHVI